jgi:hypothetical protein
MDTGILADRRDSRLRGNERPARQMRRSEVAAETLRETAEQVGDKALKAALERLARHHSGTGDPS